MRFGPAGGMQTVLYGAPGNMGGIYKEILDVFAPDLNFAGFIDTYKTGIFQGYSGFKPLKVSDKENKVILVGVWGQRQQILNELVGYGYKYNEDMFVMDVLSW